MKYVLLVPFVLQGCLMLIDEFYFHRRRGLGTWERIGHPVDTLSVVAVYAWMIATPPTALSLGVACGLAAFSCLLVTKDEFVHTKECTSQENWLHALLFVLHPLVLISAILVWPLKHIEQLPDQWRWLGTLRGMDWHLWNLLLSSIAMFAIQNILWNFGPVSRRFGFRTKGAN